MRIEFNAEVKSFNHKPAGPKASEGVLTLSVESFKPGDEWRDLLNQNGAMLKVIIVDEETGNRMDGKRERVVHETYPLDEG
jgi:hypothetical protein